MYVVIAILIFGILIAIHEFGHFMAAKAFGVKVNEFAIGMGPAILKKQGKETLYSLRLLPIGGFCSMEGEDEDSDDPRSFTKLRSWKKIIVLVAGSFMNLLLGFIVVVLLYLNASGFAGNVVADLEEGFPYGGENGLQVGDEIVEIDGEKIYYTSDFSTFMALSTDGKVDMTVIRDGEKVELKDFELKPAEYEINGEKVTKYGIYFNFIEGNFKSRMQYSVYCIGNFVRMVRMGLVSLITGQAGLKDMSGVVGIVDTMNDIGKQSATVSIALSNIAYMGAFIAVNLAVMNMLQMAVKLMNAQNDYKRATRNADRAIQLLNTIKLKYVNVTNAIDYTREKFHVISAGEFNRIWEAYLDAVKQREKFEINNDDLRYYNNRLVRMLSEYKLYDAKVWIPQALALVNHNEMVEVTHNLNERRQKIRARIEKSAEIIKGHMKDVETLLPDLSPEVAAHVREIMETVEKLGVTR